MMIVGKRRSDTSRSKTWVNCFAFLPTRLVCGRIAWWEVIEQRWVLNAYPSFRIYRQLGSTDDPYEFKPADLRAWLCK